MPDPTTQSNYLSITTEHVHLDWQIDFDRKRIEGEAKHTLLVRDEVVKEAVYVCFCYYFIVCGVFKRCEFVLSLMNVWIVFMWMRMCDRKSVLVMDTDMDMDTEEILLVVLLVATCHL